jgi:hypothetical protein
MKNTDLSDGNYILQREICWNNKKEIIDEIKVSAVDGILSSIEPIRYQDSKIKTLFHDNIHSNYVQVKMGNNISSQLYKIKDYTPHSFKFIMNI